MKAFPNTVPHPGLCVEWNTDRYTLFLQLEACSQGKEESDNLWIAVVDIPMKKSRVAPATILQVRSSGRKANAATKGCPKSADNAESTRNNDGLILNVALNCGRHVCIEIVCTRSQNHGKKERDSAGDVTENDLRLSSVYQRSLAGPGYYHDPDGGGEKPARQFFCSSRTLTWRFSLMISGGL